MDRHPAPQTAHVFDHILSGLPEVVCAPPTLGQLTGLEKKKMAQDVLLVESTLPLGLSFPLFEEPLLIMSPYLPLLHSAHFHQHWSGCSIFHHGVFIGQGMCMCLLM